MKPPPTSCRPAASPTACHGPASAPSFRLQGLRSWLQGPHSALRRAHRAPGPLLRMRLPRPEIQALRHRRRPQQTPLRGRGRGRRRHQRRTPETPPRAAPQARHARPSHAHRDRFPQSRQVRGAGLRAHPRRCGKVFDLSQERTTLRDRYGRNTFGQSCLMARRLVEQGVPYVTINYKGWDTHKQHFEIMRRRLPELDAGFATLLEDLPSAACSRAPSSGGAASSAARHARSCGRPHGMAGATISATASARCSPAAASPAAM
jgi:hypothetical protein